MVQLKVQSARISDASSCISIPYGSIKRLDAGAEESSFKQISIPYGSIKRVERSIVSIFKVISIPYGSIKSDLCTGEVSKINISIPYGSIKRVSLQSFQMLYGYFNSLWFN